MLAEKLRAAGIKTAHDDLTALAEECSQAESLDVQATRFLAGLDAATAHELLSSNHFIRGQVLSWIRDLLPDARGQLFVEHQTRDAPSNPIRASGAAGQSQHETRNTIAGGDTTGASPAARDHSVRDAQRHTVSRGIPSGASRGGEAIPALETIPRAPPAKPSTVTAHGLASIAAIAKRSMLDLFVINGQPIKSIRAGEARGWADSRRRDSRFVSLITDGLPDEAIIGDHRTGEEADKLWKLAQKELANA